MSNGAVLAAPLAPARFEDVYGQTFEAVWRTLRRMGVAATELEDAAQDVFLVVHRRLSDFAGRSTVRTWVLGVAVRVAREHLRKKAQREKHQTIDEQQVDAGPMPDAVAAHTQARELVERLLLQLEETRREVFVLFELEQLSAPEISEVLGTNLNTVYSRLRLARRDFECAVANLEAGHD